MKKKSEVRYNPTLKRTPHRPRRVRVVSALKRQINGMGEEDAATEETATCGEIFPTVAKKQHTTE